jgi:hypothetical protein
LKRGPGHGRLLATFDLFVPALDLHLRCSWLRDDRGREYVGLPKVKITAPDGKIHLKSLVRWSTARAEERFQRSALRALHTLLAHT